MPQETPATDTDTTVSSDFSTIAESPAQALASYYHSLSNALGQSAHNAVSAQQQQNIAAQATTTEAVTLLLGIAPQTAQQYPGNVQDETP
ncbi:RebB family R body protein [Gallaecimonas sp. GXIMD1310]|uniref:RebB family R body protein n=1 Tax=Gallaecimonas sp. GXIMD1310 TaxID=3131926 RepID=UPI00324FC739